MADSIERFIDLAAPLDRVWQALTDHSQFGTWFRVAIDAPFATDELATGRITYPGYEGLRWEVRVAAIEPQHRFAFTWHPYAVDPDRDYSQEEPTLVEFRLEPRGTGTHLTVTESGFDRIPADRREEALRSNSGGWTEQLGNIAAHVGG